MRTRDQLVDRTLRKLRVVGEGQAGSDEQQKVIDDDIDAFIAALREDRIYPSASSELFQENEFEPFATILAWRNSDVFGKQFDYMKAKLAENRLRRMNKQPLNTNRLSVDAALLRPSREPFDGR